MLLLIYLLIVIGAGTRKLNAFKSKNTWAELQYNGTVGDSEAEADLLHPPPKKTSVWPSSASTAGGLRP